MLTEQSLRARLHAPRVFDSAQLPADPEVLGRLVDGTHDADLAARPVVLPDFHHKRKLEMPSSIAVATVASIRPTLTSGSVNCGMALLALDVDRPERPAIEQFFRRVRERFPYPKGNRRELTTAEAVSAATDGSHFAARRWDLDGQDLARVEEGGRLDLDAYGGAARLSRELPALTFFLAGLRFGSIGPSNHFVELQTVEEILDPAAAGLLGVRQGQVTLQYHAGGGVLTGEIGRLFGRRTDYPRHLRAAMAVQKPLFHLGTARSAAQLRERLGLYFSDGCPPVARYSDEGQRLLLANAAAMNYGFAFRLATYAALRTIIADSFGGRRTTLVVDSPHNSIYEEDVDGSSAVVHRHNACRAFPASRMPPGTVFATTGQAVLVPGTSRTSSYLCVAGANSAASLHSACHGAGTVVKQYADRPDAQGDSQARSTLRFRYSDAEAAVTPHHDDSGIDAALGILTRNALVRPVARLRPFAVLN